MTLAEAKFQGLADLILTQARHRGDAPALFCQDRTMRWQEMAQAVDALAGGLWRAGVRKGDRVALLTSLTIEGVVALLATLRCGACAVSLSSMSSGEQLAAMIADSDSNVLMCSAVYRDLVARAPCAHRVALDFSGEGWTALAGFMLPGTAPAVALVADDEFNLVYSSGTTSEPSGILQSQGMRLAHAQRAARFGYGPESVTLLSTPLSSNITTVALYATLVNGGAVVLLPKFDSAEFLALSERYKVTHTTAVPVQYSRILAHPDFGERDLSSYKAKISVGSALPEDVKRDLLARWPGSMNDLYASTEGGVTCILAASEFPDKLHTIGKPAPGNDVRMIGEDGKEVPRGEAGEMVGRSGSMMSGYFRNPEKTEAITWRDANGDVFYRTGDIARYDGDGFIVLVDRKKDMIISGGLNVYPSDIEKVLATHPDVLEAAVVGVPDRDWGEVPVAFVVRRAGAGPDTQALRQWANARLGKVQRIARLHFQEMLPRSPIGKVLKRVLRDGGAG